MQSNQKAYHDAVSIHSNVARVFDTFLGAVAAKDEAAQLRLEKIISASVPAGLYEHWKSRDEDPKFYVVHGAGVEQDVHNPLVGYASLYGPRAGNITFRNLLDEQRGFLSPINRLNGPPFPYAGPRFVLIRELTPPQIGTVLLHADELARVSLRTEVTAKLASILKIDVTKFLL